MRTFNEFITKSEVSESEEINEKKDLSKYKQQMIELVDDNNTMAERLLAATLTENKRLIEVVKAINNIVDFEKDNPIHEYTYKIYNLIHNEGRKKYGKEEWNKNIYKPQGE